MILLASILLLGERPMVSAQPQMLNSAPTGVLLPGEGVTSRVLATW